MRPLRRSGRAVDFTDRISLGRSASRRDLSAVASGLGVRHASTRALRGAALAARLGPPRHRCGATVHRDQEVFFAEQLARAEAIVGRRVMWAHAGAWPRETMLVEAMTQTGMVLVSGYVGEFAPHLFVVVES